MKGVILAAGPGEELRPITYNCAKPMVHILDKPLLEYTIRRLRKNGISEIYVVVGPYQEQIRDYFGRGGRLNVDLHYVVQPEDDPGIDGAIRSVNKFFGPDDQFVLTHGDIMASSRLITRTLNAAENTGAEMSMAVTLQSELQDFGVVTMDAKGLIEKVIPSGEEKEGNYVVAGTFLLSGKIFTYLNQNTPFNQCFNHFIQDGGEVAGGIWNETWIDVGRPWDILRATTYLLEKMDRTEISVKANIEPNVEIKGAVRIEEGATILNGTVISGPVYIGRNAFIGNNSLIRDHSAIYHNSKIGMGVEIRSSVIMQDASIARLSYVGASIVGTHATMHSGAITINTNTPPSPIETEIQGQKVTVPLKKFGAVIGPNSHIGVHSSLRPGTIVHENIIIDPHKIISGNVISDQL